MVINIELYKLYAQQILLNVLVEHYVNVHMSTFLIYNKSKTITIYFMNDFLYVYSLFVN